jgi:hypothetical protein
MNEYESLSHTEWECKYHVVFIPKYRRKALHEQLRRNLGACRLPSVAPWKHPCKLHDLGGSRSQRASQRRTTPHLRIIRIGNYS